MLTVEFAIPFKERLWSPAENSVNFKLESGSLELLYFKKK